MSDKQPGVDFKKSASNSSSGKRLSFPQELVCCSLKSVICVTKSPTLPGMCREAFPSVGPADKGQCHQERWFRETGPCAHETKRKPYYLLPGSVTDGPEHPELKKQPVCGLWLWGGWTCFQAKRFSSKTLISIMVTLSCGATPGPSSLFSATMDRSESSPGHRTTSNQINWPSPRKQLRPSVK